jgi:hypothetical protein
MSLFAALSPLPFSVVAAGAGPCNAIPGWDQVLADEATRIVVLGEVHGSNEAPAVVADAACLTAQTRPVVIALEQPSVDQAAIDAFIASDGGEAAREAFLAAQMWNFPMKDGRSSEAYFGLFEKLRQMRAAGTIEAVVAFQPSTEAVIALQPSAVGLERPSQAIYEKAMAGQLLAGAKPGTTVIALVGNLHAMLTESPFEPRFMPMATHLPAGSVVTLFVVPNGGETWSCQRGACGVNHTGGPRTPRERGVVLGEGAPTYSGVLFLGVPATPSPPQAAPAG